MLLGNGTVLNKSPLKFLAGSTVSTETGQRASFQRSGAERNRFYVDQETTANNLWAEPSASYPPASFTLLPQKGGWISSRNETWARFSASATGVRGLPSEASASFSITTNNPSGELVRTVLAGGAPASFAITTNAPLLTALINGAALASFSITTNTPTLVAIASIVANSSISISTNAPTMHPLDDTSPLRTASASFAITGSLNRYAVGHMVGAALPYTELSPQSLASAVRAEMDSSSTKLAHLDVDISSRLATMSYIAPPSSSANAEAVLSAAASSPIHADTRKMNGAQIQGDGSKGNAWRGAD